MNGTQGRRRPDPISVIDSHTGGQPTRVIVHGAPDLGHGEMIDRREILGRDHTDYIQAVAGEPRGNAQIVGAVLCEPVRPASTAGVVFFNDVGCLWMCGHGVIGLMVTLARLGRIEPGRHVIETPAGDVIATLHDEHTVSVRNVPCYRHRRDVRITVPGFGSIAGDVAWGGNWFFLSEDHGLEIRQSNIPALTDLCRNIRQTLNRNGITGTGDGFIDHIELFGPPDDKSSDAKNFVLCPGDAYDRSPCGTGTSAKVSCLVEDGRLAPGSTWRQAGILGSVFEASCEPGEAGTVVPTITGNAFVNAESTLILDPDDPFCFGVPDA